MSNNIKWSEDTRLIAELDNLRQRKLGFMAKCYFCGAKSVGIKAIEEKLFSVCIDHQV
jgi:hypothetical protein